MYSVGSTFYMLYFGSFLSLSFLCRFKPGPDACSPRALSRALAHTVFSFPMFAQLDEALTVNWTIADTVKDAMTCGMAVFIACDAWRIAACYFIPSMSARNCRPPYGYCA